MKSNEIKCPNPKCKKTLGKITENGFIRWSMAKDKRSRVGGCTTNDEYLFECSCNFSGLYIVNEGWTYSAMQMYDFE